MSTFSRQGGEWATDEVKLDCLGFALDEYEAERALRHGHSCPAPAGARVAARVWAIGKDIYMIWAAEAPTPTEEAARASREAFLREEMRRRNA